MPPAIADFDLFYYLPGYPTRLLAASTEMPIVGNALTLTGSEYDNVQETAYVTKGGPSWSPGTAYVSADLDSVPTEILCYFKTGASVVSLPTIAITSDTTGQSRSGISISMRPTARPPSLSSPTMRRR